MTNVLLPQTINFFNLGSKLCLVDLPGYGFAYAKEEFKDAWVELVKEYVSTRVGLKRVCLLTGTKWRMKPRDHELIDLMERAETKYQVLLTKTDSVFPIDAARRAMQIEEVIMAYLYWHFTIYKQHFLTIAHVFSSYAFNTAVLVVYASVSRRP
ncbi:GTP-binding protein 8 [Pyrus ussuriensis x Pyrus communis]|uniref:GTP-binding protein 8 n=1 Tax=Pyrus ussuriensis x Pyrus communis TaxID=2448454 RepID=A0A5N5G0L1_9ROSA|nr:GTP-binding protein 8 [Pyrus ussuriensis x Pyrus communis]